MVVPRTQGGRKARSALICLLMAVILASPLGRARAAPAPTAPGEAALLQPARPLADVLNPDGTLNIPIGFEGGLDPTGWRLVSGSGEAPRFAPAAAQAAGDVNWDDRFYRRGMDERVYALLWSGDSLYVGGGFTHVGKEMANHIAKWDGSSWSALGAGVDGTVKALAWDGTNLYVGGLFYTAGGATAYRIARWDGAAWSAVGTGMNQVVEALAWDGSSLYAGGAFTTAGGVSARYVARWDGPTDRPWERG